MPEASNQAAAAGDGSVRYFLVVDGLDGGSTAEGFEAAFDISSALIDITNDSGLKTDFGDLELKLKSGSNTDELMRLLATGQHIAKVQLVEARQNGQGEWIAVNDYRLGDVQLSAFGLGDSGISTLSLAYGDFQQTVGGETFGWDIGLNSALGTPIGVPVGTAENPVTQFKDVSWFLAIEGLDGGGPNGAFRISGFDFDMTLAVASGGGGGGSGKASFDPLALQLELGSAAEEILEWLASGKVISAVQLIGRTANGSGETAYDLRLASVRVVSAEVDGKDDDAIDLSFGAFSLTTLDKTGAAETFSFNISGNTSGNTPLAAPTASAEDALTSGHASWQMVIDGLNGGGKAEGFVGAFDVVDFSFGGTNSAVSGGGGGGSGKVSFDELTVTFGAGTALDELMELLATGQHLSRGVRIAGDLVSGGKVHADAYDLRLNDATVTGITQLANGNVAVAFDFGLYSLTTAGEGGTRETSGWNVAANTKVSTELTAAVGSEEAFSDGPDKASDYYLVVEGLDGGADVKGRAQAFAVSSFTFDALMSSSGVGGGGGSGKAEFSPLSVKLDLGSAAVRLLERWAGDVDGFSVQLVGTDPSRNGSPVVYDLRLGDASVASISQDGKGLDLVSFDFGQFSLATGKGDNREAFGFDLGDNSGIDEVEAPKGADQAARTGHAMNYLLAIEGIDGGGPKGAFAIDDFSFDVSRGDDGEQTSLSLTLDIGSAADELLKLVAKGTHVSLERLVGNETGQGGLATAYDLRLGDLVVTGLAQNSQGKDVLTLAYDRFSLSTKDDKGKVTTEGFDFGSNTDPGLLLPAKTGEEDGADGTDLNYWLTIDGLNSGAKTKGHEGAFALESFDLDIANLTSNVGGGGGSGKTVFDPLTLLLDAGVAADELLDLIAKSKFTESVSIVGMASKGDRKGEAFFEIRLETVLISQFRQEDSEDDGLALSYDAISFTTWNAKGKAETYGFDINNVRDLDHEIPAPVVGEL